MDTLTNPPRSPRRNERVYTIPNVVENNPNMEGEKFRQKSAQTTGAHETMCPNGLPQLDRSPASAPHVKLHRKIHNYAHLAPFATF